MDKTGGCRKSGFYQSKKYLPSSEQTELQWQEFDQEEKGLTQMAEGGGETGGKKKKGKKKSIKTIR